MDCLQLRPVYSRRRDRFVNSAFPNKKHLAQKLKYIYEKTNLKVNVCRNSTFQVNRKRMLPEDDVLSRATEPPFFLFLSDFMRRPTRQTFLTINLASQQKTTKLYFSSQVRKQFKLLTVSFKPLRCCLRREKLVNCHV